MAAGTVSVLVLAAGRWLLRPLFYEIANSRLRELFTLAVLFVALASAYVSQLAGFSMALGAFLAGMMLAETEYSHQIESVIRPFRDILLGLFFISVGMLLDFYALWRELGLIVALLLAMLIIKAIIATCATRLFVDSTFKSIRTGITLAWRRIPHCPVDAAAAEPRRRSRDRAAHAGGGGAEHGAGAGDLANNKRVKDCC